MSIVSIYVSEDAPKSEAVKVLRPITDESLSCIQKTIAGKQPIYRRELFMNDFAEIADTLRMIVNRLEASGIRFTITEDIKGVEERITKGLLFKILADSESYRL